MAWEDWQSLMVDIFFLGFFIPLTTLVTFCADLRGMRNAGC
jgi:hypothetical protein